MTCKLPYLVIQSLHTKRNKAVKSQQEWLQYKFKCLSSIVWLTSFLKNNDLGIIRKRGWGGGVEGAEQGNQIIAKKKKEKHLLNWYSVFSCVPVDIQSLALDFLFSGSNYGKPKNETETTHPNVMPNPALCMLVKLALL